MSRCHACQGDGFDRVYHEAADGSEFHVVTDEPCEGCDGTGEVCAYCGEGGPTPCIDCAPACAEERAEVLADDRLNRQREIEG